MPIVQILILASVIVAIVLGVNAFRGGLQISNRSQKRMTGWPAKVIGTICLLYGIGVVVFFILWMAGAFK